MTKVRSIYTELVATVLFVWGRSEEPLEVEATMQKLNPKDRYYLGDLKMREFIDACKTALDEIAGEEVDVSKGANNA